MPKLIVRQSHCLHTEDLIHLKKTVESIAANEGAKDLHLYIFSDAPKNDSLTKEVATVREYIKTINGFKTLQIFEAEKNVGLADPIIGGVTKVLENHRDVIVFEDDILTHRDTLNYFEYLLNFYRTNQKSLFDICKQPNTKSF